MEYRGISSHLTFAMVPCTTTMAKIAKVKCPRCHGTGLVESCRHVRNGVCFRCWGTGDDLRHERDELEKRVEALRNEYRAARHRRASEESLAEIVVRGKAAVSAVTQFDIHVRVISGNV